MVQQHSIYIVQFKKGGDNNDQPCKRGGITYYYDCYYGSSNGKVSPKSRSSSSNVLRHHRRVFTLCLLSSLFVAFFFLARLSLLKTDTINAAPEKAITHKTVLKEHQHKPHRPLCSSMANDSICCDRSSTRADICFMRGDVRMHSASNSFFLVSSNTTSNLSNVSDEEQTVRPYTRKWEANVMATIDELHLRKVPNSDANVNNHHCDVVHDVPAVVFSTGGYTGNVYHEFNDGILPLFITSRHLRRRVVFVILEYHSWWMTKYRDVLSRLSNYPPIDFTADRRTHCFPEVITGLRIHGELTVDRNKMPHGKTIHDFRKILDEAYRGRIRYLDRLENSRNPKPTASVAIPEPEKPKLVIVSRTASRAIENEAELTALARQVGFRVEILKPDPTTELCKVYGKLNSSDAVIGVHGAAMTHFLFMRPGRVFIQIVPLGTDWAAETYYGEPAVRLGLWYVGYKISANESSLYREYPSSDPVLTDPNGVAKQDWGVTKRLYLDRQNVSLDLDRFRIILVRAHRYLVEKKTRERMQLASV